MALKFEHLDQTTRSLMNDELQIDVKNGVVRLSIYLNDTGKERWVNLLIDSIKFGDDVSLGNSIAEGEFLKDTILAKTYGRPLRSQKVSEDEAFRISQYAFNRYYARAICRRAINEGVKDVEIYRAEKVSSNQEKLLKRYADEEPLQANSTSDEYRNRAISRFHETLGNRLNAVSTLEKLRNQTIGRSIDNALGLGLGPGGWSLKLIH